MTRNNAEPGSFYAVGIGPGAPDLLTYRAAKLIEAADIIIAPRSRLVKTSLALQTVQHLIREEQEVIDHVYAMKRDIDYTRKNWNQVAKRIALACKAGKSVVQITIGDPMIYSTSAYLLDELAKESPEIPINVIPGISAFQAVSSLFKRTLTIQEDRMLLMPATNLQRVEEAFSHCETLVLYKAGKQLVKLKKLLKKHNLLSQAKVAFYAEQNGRELLFDSIDDAINATPGYMATVILYINRQEWELEK